MSWPKIVGASAALRIIGSLFKKLKNLAFRAKSSLPFVGKLLLGAATLFGTFVLFDDWWSRRTRLELYPLSISVDSTLVFSSPFSVEIGDALELQRLMESPEGQDLQQVLTAIRMPAYVGGNPKLLTQYTLHSLEFAITSLNLMEAIGSTHVQPGELIDSTSIQAQGLLRIREHLRLLNKIKEKYKDQVSKKVRILVKLVAANGSNNRTAVIEPCLLRVFADTVIDLRMRLHGHRSEMQMLGMTIKGGQPISVIENRSFEEITLASDEAEIIGHHWQRLEILIDSMGVKAEVTVPTVEGKKIKTPRFPFSLRYSDTLFGEKFEMLRQ